MKKLPIVAIIGQTNAGKSSLFNRLTRAKTAIVAREAGTTRDNVVARVDERYVLVDTAGLKDPEDDFEASIQMQIEDAIASADVILLTLDGTKYTDHGDRMIARKALKSGKPVVLVLNKSDLRESLPRHEFLSLGIRDVVHVSATTGLGIEELREKLDSTLDEGNETELREKLQQTFERRILARKNGPPRGHFSGSQYAQKSAAVFPSDAACGGKGLDSLLEETVEEMPLASTSSRTPRLRPVKTGAHAESFPREDYPAPLKIALIGRPNVGKSSLFNALAEKQQAIVADLSGTTRDVNRAEIRYKGRDLEIMDTAGLRRQGKREVGVEKFSALRTLAAIEEADVCCLLIDSTEPHVKLDQVLAGQIVEAGKGIVLIVTKTDLEGKEPDAILNLLEEDFNFIPYAPVVLTSSVSGKNVTKIFELALEIDRARHTEVKTSELNKVLMDAVLAHPPAGLKNTMPKLRYMTQSDTCPPWFIVYGSNLSLLHWSYKRFLERRIREQFPFVGTPVFFSFRNRD